MLRILLLLTSLAGDQLDEFPVPRGLQEFRLLGPHVRGYCEARGGDLEAFRHAVFPYGPMDLSVGKGTPDEASTLRNIYLGMVGAICKVDAAALSKKFHCGPGCIASRKKELVARIGKIRALVSEFRDMGPLEVASQWGIVGEYRVNNVFSMMGQVVETKPSKTMGFVPSDSWTQLSSVDVYLKRLGVSEARFTRFMQEMKRLSLAAMAREEGWVRVVLVGIGDSESGLLFRTDSKANAPSTGAVARDGRRYVVIEQLDKSTYFYETD